MSLRDLIRKDVEDRGRYCKLNDSQIENIENKIEGRLMGNECVWWKGVGGDGTNNDRPHFVHKGKKTYVGVSLYHNIVEDIGEKYGAKHGYQVCVLHKCISESLCVNPAHLYLGSAQDNIKDAIVRDKTIKTIFTDEEVIRMREKRREGVTQIALALEFNCSRQKVSQICSGHCNKFSGGPLTMVKMKRKANEIRDEVAKGKTFEEVKEVLPDVKSSEVTWYRSQVNIDNKSNLEIIPHALRNHFKEKQEALKLIYEGKTAKEIRDLYPMLHPNWAAHRVKTFKNKNAPEGKKWYMGKYIDAAEADEKLQKLWKKRKLNGNTQ